MSRDYTPGLYTVTVWSMRGLGTGKDHLLYRGADDRVAARIFDALSRRVRRGLVQMTNPIGKVSTTCRTGDPATSWATTYAHPVGAEGAR